MKSEDIILGSACRYNVAYYSPRPPAAPLMLVPVASPAPTIAGNPRNTIANGRNALSQSTSVAESVLRDLITELPVSPTSQRSRAEDTRVPRCKPSSAPVAVATTPAFSRLSSASSVHGDGVLRCSVATQAHTTQSSSVVEGSGSLTPVATPSESEWVCEARALRDCHLRLVLRQLRHIARLNRAVERGACALPVIDGDQPITP